MKNWVEKLERMQNVSSFREMKYLGNEE